ncbi:MAG: T9SS type A sorting domain-containing protein [Saprospiraceae bacterium]
MKNFQFYLLASLLLGLVVPSWAKIIYVNKNALGSNNGSNWDNAYNELSTALPTAQTGDAVWVAKGIYKPYIEGVSNSFTMVSGIKLLGGFSGWESNENQRNWDLNETILTAQYMIGQNGVVYPPYNILYCVSTDSASIVDGFTFRDVLAGPFDGEPCGSDQHKCYGGGIFLYSPSPSIPTFLTVQHCRFLDNCCAAGGSAIGINFSEGSGGYTIKHCSFKNNTALDGGAMSIVVGTNAQYKMLIDSCLFEENHTPPLGIVGAVSIYNANTNIDLTISHTIFQKNSSVYAGCLFHQAYDNVAPVKLTNCSFIENTAGKIANFGTGGALLGGNYHINGCVFQHNKALVGGAIDADWLRIENSVFNDNLGIHEGGAIVTYHSNYFLNTTFINNNSGVRGAGILHKGLGLPHDTLINCLFYGNKVNGEKEWMATYGASVHIANSYVDAENCESLKNGFAIGDSLSCGPNMFFNIDPLFRDTAAGDFRLQGCSPLLNKGDSTWAARFGLLTDLAGNSCWQDGVPDIGAYETPRLRAEAEWQDVRCYGQTDGTTTVFAEGGFSPYTFLWNGNQQDSLHTGLPAGIYTTIVRDSDLCADTLIIIIGQPDSLQLTATVTPSSSTQIPNGSIVLDVVSGGTMPYTYEWSTGSTEDAINNLESGIYTVTVTDEQGCSNLWEFEVLLITGTDQQGDLTNLRIYPNPATDWVHLLLPEAESEILLEVVDASGKTIIIQHIPKYEKVFNLNVKGLPSGAYTLIFKQNGRTTHIGQVVKRL